MRVQTISKTILSLAAVTLLSFGAFAADGGHRHGGRGFERMAQHLSLTESQQSQLKPIFEAQKAQRKQLREQFQSQMRAILTPEQVAQLDQHKAERRAERGEGRREGWKRGERGGKFAKLNLSDTQKAQLKALREARKPQMQAQRQQFEQQLASILTAEQRAKVEEMKQRRAERRGNRGEK